MAETCITVGSRGAPPPGALRTKSFGGAGAFVGARMGAHWVRHAAYPRIWEPGFAGVMEFNSSTNSATSTGVSLSQQSGDVDTLWKHVTKVAKIKERGGNTKIRCNFCNNEFTGSYSRVKVHLLKIKEQGVAVCAKVTSEHLKEFQRELTEVEERRRPIYIPLPPSTQTQSCNAWGPIEKREPIETKKGLHPNNPIKKAYKMEMRALLNSEIARGFYSGGLPFHYARNPHHIKSYNMASEFNLVGYVPPTYNALRTTLLQKERAHVERLLDPIKITWKERGVTIVSNGWSDTQRRPLINFMAVTELGPMFIKAVNCEGNVKDKFFMADLIKEVIMQVGAQHVVQVITDNTPVCKAAGMLVEAQFSHIFWTPCVVHTLNLALKNICDPSNIQSNKDAFIECHWIKEVLLGVAETRFTSMIIMLKRLKLLKHALERLVLSEEWSTYREYDQAKASLIRTTILDELWWDQVDYILEFTDPIYVMDEMIEKVKSIIYRHEKKEHFEKPPFYDVVYIILIDRWTKSSSPLHCLAHSLNPRYYSDAWLNRAQGHQPPHLDVELSVERNKCIRRYFLDGRQEKL
ncbi:uncharacterized protein LOC141684222 [Apium graveolens]|uniref:uncharacterized protein LOC141684222 n=1 Tax=Apium graveolens TaxID=4045 RepID=UPI003D7B1D4A